MLLGCSEPPPNLPHCRANAEPLNSPATSAGCLIVNEQQLLVIKHRLSGRWDIPAGGQVTGESLACTAHRETFEETGINVSVDAYITTTTSGMALFACSHQSGFTPPKYPTLPLPEWSKGEVTQIKWVDPFTLNPREWRYMDQWPEIAEAFVMASSIQK
nr:NUDIX hydrolase [Alteromonas facilis]